ncbi:DUF2561 family protein [Mycobacterium yunnanensis]|uniref:DUF2561 family protein n=1 Tax=Mycobacterium yunnanensis TaxID=368477 RepID=A0A9X2Z7P9_9MYCO|nr:DUF2561 family protein [Mycobacterium yunnanensis]MCV7423699.1 DUF2561 family protein [Mycobacterium yunnanensis]
MTTDIDNGAAGSSHVRPRPGTPDRTDRLLVVAAVALWLAALGAAVAAVVALVDLASAHTGGAEKSDTPWLLYAVIGVSALVIVGAIPLLLKARQSAVSIPSRTEGSGEATSRETPSVAQRLQPFGAPVLRRYSTPPAGHRVGFPTAAVEQIWLRCTASLAALMGAAATAIGVATYLMATDHDTASWSVYAVAGLITVGMIAVPWIFLRQLHGVLESAA